MRPNLTLNLGLRYELMRALRFLAPRPVLWAVDVHMLLATGNEMQIHVQHLLLPANVTIPVLRTGKEGV